MGRIANEFRMMRFRYRGVGRRREGSIVVLAAFFLIGMCALIALSLDLGYICDMRTEIQGSVDAAALAGAGALGVSDTAATQTAVNYAVRNPVTNRPLDPGDIQVELGRWDDSARVFQLGLEPYNAVRVNAVSPNRSLFFGRLLGPRAASVRADAIAMYQPRDIMMVLDYSGSMQGTKINSLRDAVTTFIAALQETAADDRVGFSWYNDTGELERRLTFDLDSIDSAARNREAGGWTNIGQGMEKGREELIANARPGTLKLMVLLTDGLANRPFDQDPVQYVINEANLMNHADVPIVSISFGSGADTVLMRRVADITSGVHYHVAGSATRQRDELRRVFLEVASQRPLQLVQ